MNNNSMKKLTCEIAVMAGILLLVCLICRIFMKNSLTAYIPVNPPGADIGGIRLEENGEPMVSFGEPSFHDGYMKVEVRPEKRGPGTAYAEVYDQNGEIITLGAFRVGPFRTVYDETNGDFTGDSLIFGMFTVFSLASAFLLLRFFLRCRGPQLYSYNAIYTAGFSVFALSTGILMLSITLRRLLTPSAFHMFSAYRQISGASGIFMILTFPFILVFSLLMAVSNIELLRHERKRLANVLGILLSVLLVAGEAAAFFLLGRNMSGSELEVHIQDTINNVYATVYVYFECMLLGAILCGIRAAKHSPSLDRDFIVILGCSFRKDGTLTPLLRGRVDRAVRFWREQREQTGKTAVLIPSGGQGADETMPEAEAMARYLRTECEIPEQYILKEDRSKNTYQNMEFSRKLIEERKPDAKTVFSTTNYHVFRSGVWAGLAGLEAEGIGSRTKWWFWPNAFIRECVGLMKNRIREEAVLLVVLILFFASLSMILD